jgi:Ca2+-binding EF-hand superfamily protein
LPTLQGFDRLKRGFITTPQFHRALSTLKIQVSIPELSILQKAYGHGEDDVDYFKFIEDVDSTHNQSRRQFQPIGTTPESIVQVFGHTPSGDRFVTQEVADDLIYKSKRGLFKKVNEYTDVDSLLQSLKRWSSVNGVVFHDFLSDFDHHRCGEIPVSQFRSGMSISTYELTETEFELLVQHYRSPTRSGFVRWRQFADDILSGAAPPNQDSQSTGSEPSSERQPPPNVLRILQVVARFVKARRIPLIEQFRDKDPMTHRRVSAVSFAQVLQLIGTQISKDEIDQLCAFYHDPKTTFVDYTLFVDAVNRIVGPMFEDRASSSIVVNPIPAYGNEDSPYLVSQRATAGRVNDWPTILEKLQGHCSKRRLRVKDFFRAFDGLNTGDVSAQKFRTVVGQTDLPLTAEDINVCLETFPGKGSASLFDYRSFSREIDTIFGVKELNRTPLHRGLPTVHAMPDPSGTVQSLNGSTESQCQELLDRIRQMVRTRRMNIKEQFMDYDKAPRKSYITKQQFKQSIARLGLTTDQKEFDLLCKKYRCTDLDDMNYLAFCRDVDPQ